MTAAREPSVSKPLPVDFPTLVTDAIFAAKIAAQARGDQFTKSCVLAIVREQFAFWQASVKPKRKKAGETPAPRPRNEFFDVVADVFGMTVNGGAVTKMAAARIGKVVSEVRQADPNLTPEELRRICLAVRKKFDGATPLAVSLHFHEFSSAAKRTPTAMRDIHAEPGASWRQVAMRLYPDAATWANPHPFDTMAWHDVSVVIRPDILKRMPSQ